MGEPHTPKEDSNATEISKSLSVFFGSAETNLLIYLSDIKQLHR